MKAKVKIHPHQDYDKSYTVSINNDLSMEIDYDDVDHQTVDAMVKTFVSVIENNWDDKLYKENLKAEKLKQYNSDKWLREEYPTFEDFYKEF